MSIPYMRINLLKVLIKLLNIQEEGSSIHIKKAKYFSLPSSLFYEVYHMYCGRLQFHASVKNKK